MKEKLLDLFGNEIEEKQETTKKGMNAKTINELIGVDESFYASTKLMNIILNKEEREKLFMQFLEITNDLSFDWFTDYFQEEHSDRKNKKQDFTPKSVVKLLTMILGQTKSNLDIAAGTGGLTISVWNKNKEATYRCEEFSDRAIPFLLFNLSIRNIEGSVWHGDSLSRKQKNLFLLEKGDKFSKIIKSEEQDEKKANTVIMNPPYSFAWEHLEKYKYEQRFSDYGLAPKSKADFSFLLEGLYNLDDNGKMVIILPHGVLFRTASEGEIRKRLIEKKEIEAIIGLPSNLFLNTAISTVVIVLKKNSENVFFINADKEFEKQKTFNILKEEHINKIVETYNERKKIKYFSKSVDIEEIKKNDFNLNIPRYISKEQIDETKSYAEILEELQNINKEIEKNSKELSEMIDELVTTDGDKEKENILKELASLYRGGRLQ